MDLRYRNIIGVRYSLLPLSSKFNDMNPYVELAKLVLPAEVNKYFELTKVETEKLPDGSEMLHIYLEEDKTTPDDRKDLIPNGFFREMLIRDFPIRDRKVTLHVKRRRWIDGKGENVSTDWTLVQNGTRYSVEFAAFLKGLLGQIPDYGPLA